MLKAAKGTRIEDSLPVLDKIQHEENVSCYSCKSHNLIVDSKTHTLELLFEKKRIYTSLALNLHPKVMETKKKGNTG